MKKILLLVLIFVSLFTSCNTFIDSTPDVQKELNVLVWNCWRKGDVPDGISQEEKDENITEIIRASEADVVLLLETYGIAKKLGDALDMDFYLPSNNPEDTGPNLCILWKKKYDLLKIERHPHTTFQLISCVLDIEGTPVRFADVWIDYLPDTTDVPVDMTAEEIIDWERNFVSYGRKGDRIPQIKSILRCLKYGIEFSDEVPLIMGGDFNSHSHLDWTDATKDLEPYGHGGKVVPWEVSSLIAEAGFTDSWREIYPNPATHYGVTWRSDSQPCRIDYIYYQGAKIEAQASETHNHERLADGFEFRDASFTYPSDHGFVLTKFIINKQN